MKNFTKNGGLGASNLAGLVFVLVGILLFLVLIGYELPIDVGNAEIALEYAAAIGSILGGLALLFKGSNKHVPQQQQFK